VKWWENYKPSFIWKKSSKKDHEDTAKTQQWATQKPLRLPTWELVDYLT